MPFWKAQPPMFYVLYVGGERYLDENGDRCAYAKAERFRKPSEVILRTTQIYEPAARWVGPCRATEAP